MAERARFVAGHRTAGRRSPARCALDSVSDHLRGGRSPQLPAGQDVPPTFSVSWDQEAFEVERPGSALQPRSMVRLSEVAGKPSRLVSDCPFQILPKRVLKPSEIEEIKASLSIRRGE